MGNAFNINKCQIIQVGSKNIKKDNEMCGIKIYSVHSFKHLVFTVASNLKFSQQCNELVKKANQIMALIKKKIPSRIKMLYYLCIILLSDLIWSMPCSFGFPIMEETLLNPGQSNQDNSFITKQTLQGKLSYLSLFSFEKSCLWEKTARVL